MMDDLLKQVAYVLERSAEAGPRRSSMYVWMWTNYDALEAQFAITPPNWSAIADGLTKIGLLNRDGSAPSKKTAQDTFYRVRGRRRKAKQGTVRSPAKSVIPAGVHFVAPATAPRPSTHTESLVDAKLRAASARVGARDHVAMPQQPIKEPK
jgi:hypothetical protein